jgi:hypothetical protein
MAKKTFDAVEMTRRIRDAHYEQLKDASPEERIRFYRDKAQRLHKEIDRPLRRDQEPHSI